MAESKRSQKLFIGNVGQSVTQEDLNEYFSKYGEISDLKLLESRDYESGHRGFGFIRFVDASVAEQVKQETHTLANKTMQVNNAKPKLVKFFVGGIARDRTTTESMRTFFEQFGEIEDIFCIVPRGFGFVTMVEDGDNLAPLKTEDHHEIDGKRCEVKVARPKEEYQSSEEWNRKQLRRGGHEHGGHGGGRGGQGGYNNNYQPAPYNSYYPAYGAPAYGTFYSPQGGRGWGGGRGGYTNTYRPY